MNRFHAEAAECAPRPNDRHRPAMIGTNADEPAGETALDRALLRAPALAAAAARPDRRRGGRSGSPWRGRPGPSRSRRSRARPGGRCWWWRRATTRRATWPRSWARCSAAVSIALWPTRGVPAGGAVGPSPHLVGLRARALATLGAPGSVVIAGAPALAERTRRRRRPVRSRSRCRWAQALSLDELVDRLVAMGYERVPQVEERGDLSVRGGILDVYPSTADLPRAHRALRRRGREHARVLAVHPAHHPADRAARWHGRPAEPAGGDVADPLARPGARRRGASCGWRPAEHPAALARGGGAPGGRGRRRRPGRRRAGVAGALAPGRVARPRSAGRISGARPSTRPRRASPPARATEAEAELARLGRCRACGCVLAFAPPGRHGARRRAGWSALRAVELEPGEPPPRRARSA